MTYRSRSNYKAIGLYRPREIKDGRLYLDEVGAGGKPTWYGLYAEDRDVRVNYETCYINNEGKRAYAIGEEYLPTKFKECGYRAMFLGEHGILKIYRGLVHYKRRVMLDREKFCRGDFSQLTDEFESLVGGVIYKGRFLFFISHLEYLLILEGGKVTGYLDDAFTDLGMNPPKDFLIQC